MITVNDDGTFDLRSDGARKMDDLMRDAYNKFLPGIINELTRPNPVLERIVAPKIVLAE